MEPTQTRPIRSTLPTARVDTNAAHSHTPRTRRVNGRLPASHQTNTLPTFTPNNQGQKREADLGHLPARNPFRCLNRPPAQTGLRLWLGQHTKQAITRPNSSHFASAMITQKRRGQNGRFAGLVVCKVGKFSQHRNGRLWEGPLDCKHKSVCSETAVPRPCRVWKVNGPKWTA